MKKLLIVFCFLFMVGCSYFYEGELEVITIEQPSNRENYKYRYKIRDISNDEAIIYFSNKEFNVGDKVTFEVKQ